MSDNLPDDIPRAHDGVAGANPPRDGDDRAESDPRPDPGQPGWQPIDDHTSGTPEHIAERGGLAPGGPASEEP